MAISNFGLPFDRHASPKYDTRTAPSKYTQSAIRSWRFEQSEGIRPAEYFAVHKYLPVAMMDITTEDWVVIPKGRIVGSISTEDSSIIAYPSSSGTIYTGHSATELGADAMSGYIDNSLYGYDDFIVGALVPANGGNICSGFYSADDVTAATIKSTGAIAAAGDAINIAANAPIGVAFHDIYQDIRGKYLNYRAHADGQAILTDWYVEVPYVKVSDAGSYSGVNPQYANTYANQVTWRNVNKTYTYLSIDVNNSDVFRTGVFVEPDLIGNYKIQGGASSLSQSKTVQTVGKILAIDNRFPKGGLEDVQTYPRSGMPGTQTAGLPKFLYDFVYQCIYIGTGTAPTIEGVYDAVRGGSFGLARIQLLVS